MVEKMDFLIAQNLRIGEDRTKGHKQRTLELKKEFNHELTGLSLTPNETRELEMLQNEQKKKTLEDQKETLGLILAAKKTTLEQKKNDSEKQPTLEQKKKDSELTPDETKELEVLQKQSTLEQKKKDSELDEIKELETLLNEQKKKTLEDQKETLGLLLAEKQTTLEQKKKVKNSELTPDETKELEILQNRNKDDVNFRAPRRFVLHVFSKFVC